MKAVSDGISIHVNIGGTILDSVFEDERVDQRSSLLDQPQLDQFGFALAG
jgi:hypothetical protein